MSSITRWRGSRPDQRLNLYSGVSLPKGTPIAIPTDNPLEVVQNTSIAAEAVGEMTAQAGEADHRHDVRRGELVARQPGHP